MNAATGTSGTLAHGATAQNTSSEAASTPNARRRSGRPARWFSKNAGSSPPRTPCSAIRRTDNSRIPVSVGEDRYHFTQRREDFTMLIANPDDVTAAVQAEAARTPDARTREILLAAIAHLHAFVRDARLTEHEFRRLCVAIARVGQATN